MYCKNCGDALRDDTAICARCGCAKSTGSDYCPRCGQLMDRGSNVCPGCGTASHAFTGTQTAATAGPASGKSRVCAGIMALFLGGLGIHNFYLGYTSKGVAQLLITLISFGTLGTISSIWGFVEGIMLLCGSIQTDGKGNPLV